jgi:hypothetical protein
MQLYWGGWTLLQVGSSLAIFGVMLEMWIVLVNHESPHWSVGLGTPVLVSAALSFVIRKTVGKQTWDRFVGRRTDESSEEAGQSAEISEVDLEKNISDRRMSQA